MKSDTISRTSNTCLSPMCAVSRLKSLTRWSTALACIRLCSRNQPNTITVTLLIRLQYSRKSRTARECLRDSQLMKPSFQRNKMTFSPSLTKKCARISLMLPVLIISHPNSVLFSKRKSSDLLSTASNIKFIWRTTRLSEESSALK